MTTKLLGLFGALVAAIVGIIGILSLHVVPATPTFGAIPGHEVQGNEWTVGGITQYSVSASFTATSSSICILTSPNASSTLVSYSAEQTAGATGGGTWPVAYVGTSTIASKGTASTTAPFFLNAISLATSTPFIWSAPGAATTTATLWGTNPNSTGGTGQTAYIIPPNTPIVLQYATATPGVFSSYARGGCDATFRKAATQQYN